MTHVGTPRTSPEGALAGNGKRLSSAQSVNEFTASALHFCAELVDPFHGNIRRLALQFGLEQMALCSLADARLITEYNQPTLCQLFELYRKRLNSHVARACHQYFDANRNPRVDNMENCGTLPSACGVCGKLMVMATSCVQRCVHRMTERKQERGGREGSLARWS